MIQDTLQKLEQKVESVQVPAGYAISAGLTSTPLWMQTATSWLEFGVLVIGLLVGITTVILNLKKIRNKNGQGNTNK